VTAEVWTILALAPLAVAVVLRTVALLPGVLRRGQRPESAPGALGSGPAQAANPVLMASSRGFGAVVLGARLSALVALTIALVLPWAEAAAAGAWQLLGLAAVSLAVYLIWVGATHSEAASPILDLLVLLMVLAAWAQAAGAFDWTVPARSLTASTEPRLGTPADMAPIPLTAGWYGGSATGWPVLVQSALLLLGAAGLTVAGSAGLMLGLRWLLSRRAWPIGWPLWLDMHVALRHAMALAAVALGASLTIGMSWSLRTFGTLAPGGLQATQAPRPEWPAIAWLLAVMCLLAHRLGRRWGRWTAGLAVTAFGLVLFGFLAGGLLG
jgi:hypothetical protein